MYGRDKKYYVIVFVVLIYFITAAAFSAETWKLAGGEDFKVVSQSADDGFSLALADLKEAIDRGDTAMIDSKTNAIKKQYPQQTGPDFDLFIDSEKLYVAGTFAKAVRSYDLFMRKYPQSQFLQAALEREFLIAQAYLNGHKKKVLKLFKIKGYAEGVKVMDRVIEKSGNSPLAVKASIAIAESYEKRAKYEDAYQRWSMISSRWPTGEIGKTSLLAMARCKHAAYKGPEYDVSYLVSAQSYYENFTKRYPAEARKYEISKRLAQIKEQLAYKEYSIAQYYHRTGSNGSSEFYCNQVADNWPDTTSAVRASRISKEIENSPVKEQTPQKESKWNIKKLIMP